MTLKIQHVYRGPFQRILVERVEILPFFFFFSLELRGVLTMKLIPVNLKHPEYNAARIAFLASNIYKKEHRYDTYVTQWHPI